MNKNLIEQITKISLSMFRKNFFGVFHGSISAKVEVNKFVINKKDAIFDEIDKDSLIMLYHKRDYRWKDASLDSSIHSNIYQNINDAKYIAYVLPPYTSAFALKYDKICPKDYFGHVNFGELPIYDPRDLESWYERADVEIYRHMKECGTKVMIIRGYGVYVYDRDINQMAKTIAVIENSCRLLYLSKSLESGIASSDNSYYI